LVYPKRRSAAGFPLSIRPSTVVVMMASRECSMIAANRARSRSAIAQPFSSRNELTTTISWPFSSLIGTLRAGCEHLEADNPVAARLVAQHGGGKKVLQVEWLTQLVKPGEARAMLVERSRDEGLDRGEADRQCGRFIPVNDPAKPVVKDEPIGDSADERLVKPDDVANPPTGEQGGAKDRRRLGTSDGVGDVVGAVRLPSALASLISRVCRG
jgi:hypothetical protein